MSEPTFHVTADVPPVGTFILSSHANEVGARRAIRDPFGERVLTDRLLVEALLDQASDPRRFKDITELVGEWSSLKTEQALRNAEMASALEPTIAPGDVGVAVYERIQALRSALGGIGRITPQYNNRGEQVGGQVSITLTEHDVAALIMLITDRLPKLSVLDETMTR